jgi:exodeoxyribonuclease X
MEILPLAQNYIRSPKPIAEEGFYLARVIDVETSSDQTDTCELVEVGWVDVWFPLAGGTPLLGEIFQTFVKPLNGISIEAMAVHHITEEMAATGITQEMAQEVIRLGEPDCYVAHNAKFEAALLNIAPAPWLCTFKSALRIYPDAPRHSNQVLRYALGCQLNPDLAQPPHRAGPDAYVTAFILAKLAEHASIEQMIAWTAQPALFPKINFGMHAGTKWTDLDHGYLKWMSRQNFDEDVKWNVILELDRRKALTQTATKQREPEAPQFEYSS